MIEAHLTYFDLAVLAVLILSCLFAFFRGFVREVLSLGAWIGAGIITLYYFRDVAVLIKPSMKSEMVAGGLAALGLYITSLLGFSLLISLIMRMLKDGGEVGALDNILGLMFGAFRAAFLISMSYFMMTFFITDETMPEWLKGSYTQPAVEKGAIIFGQAAPDYMVEHSSLKKRIYEANGKKLEEKENSIEQEKEQLTKPVQLERTQQDKEEQQLNEFMDKLAKEKQ